RFAHVVHVNGQRFFEATRVSTVSKGGRLTSLAVLKSSGEGHLVRHRVREFANGTRRVDIAQLADRQLRRSAHWTFSNGHTADAVGTHDGLTVVFRNRNGQVRRLWETKYSVLARDKYRINTVVFNDKREQQGFSEVTASRSGVRSRKWEMRRFQGTEPQGGTRQSWETNKGGVVQKASVTVEGGIVESEVTSASIVGGVTDDRMAWDFRTGEMASSSNVDNAMKSDGTVVSSVGVMTINSDGTTTQAGNGTFEWGE